MDNSEDMLWDAITDSGKTKFDYPELRNNLEPAADNFLFQVIMGLAFGEERQTTALKLRSQLLMVGLSLSENEIQCFIADNEKALGMEVLAAKMAGNMVQQGGDPLMVYGAISQLLKTNPA